MATRIGGDTKGRRSVLSIIMAVALVLTMLPSSLAWGEDGIPEQDAVAAADEGPASDGGQTGDEGQSPAGDSSAGESGENGSNGENNDFGDSSDDLGNTEDAADVPDGEGGLSQKDAQGNQAQADALSALSMANASPIVRSGDTGEPNSLSFALFKLTGGSTSAFDPNKVVLGELTDVRMRITYQQRTGSSNNTLTITLPDYYSFTSIPQTSYYTASAPTSTNGGTNNQVVLSMADVSSAGNPPTWMFDIDVKLNEGSIVGTQKETDWRAGTWTPNDGACDFSVQYNSNTSKVAKQAITVVVKDYPGFMTQVYATSNPATAMSATGQNTKLKVSPTGSVANDAYKTASTAVAFSYSYPDVLKYGSVDLSQFTTTIKIPEHFEIASYTASTAASTSAVKVMPASNVGVVVAGDGKSAEFSVSDDGSDAGKTRMVGTLTIQPTEQFRDNTVQNGSIADDPVNGVLLPSGASYDIETVVADKQGTSLAVAGATGNADGSTSFATKLEVVEYEQKNLFQITPRGDVDADDPTKKIYAEVSAGKSGNAYGLAELSNKRERSAVPFGEPDFDGAGAVLTATFDENIQISSITVGSTSGYADDITNDEATVREVSYTLDDGSTVGPVSAQADGTCAIAAPAGRYITGFAITYDKYIYISAKAIATSMTYSISSVNKTTGDPFVGGEDLEMSYALTKGVGGETLAEGKNYLRIKGDECPSFSRLPATKQSPQAADFATPGTYSQGETAWTTGFALRNDFVGSPTWSDTGEPVYVDSSGKATAADGHRYTSADTGATLYRSGYLGTLENPAFTHAKSPASYDSGSYTPKKILFNGSMKLYAIMGDGNWRIEVTSQTAERAYAGELPVATVFDLPAFSDGTLEVDLHDSTQFANALGVDEYIMDAKVYYEGTLDLSPLSNGYDGTAKGTAVEKSFYQLQATSYAIDPLTGIPTGGVAAANGVSELSSWSNYVTFDNCTHVDKRHTWAKGGVFVADDSAYTNLSNKGAEAVELYWPTTTYSGSIQQDTTTTIDASITMLAKVVSGTEVWSTGGETAYLALSSQAQTYLSFSNAKFDGMAADMSIVELGGKKYLKIVNPSRAAYQRPLSAASGGQSTFEYDIAVDVTALPITPVSNISVFDQSYFEFGPSQTYYYTKGGATLKGSLRPSGSQNYSGGPAVDPQGHTYVGNNKDDYLGLYSSTAVTEHHWGALISAWRLAPVQAATQGVVLNPGVEGAFGKDQIDVKPWQESTIKAGVTLMAGNVQGGMKELHTTIKIPRANDTVTDPSTGETKTTSVDLYLSGPLAVTVPFENSSSTHPEIKYSVDGGITYIAANDMQAKVDAGEVAWTDVTHVDLFVSNIAQNDGGQLELPLTTQNGTDMGLTGEAYLDAVFTTKTADATSNRLSTYSFGPYDLTGRVWNDTDKNGNIDNGETFSETTLYLYKNYNEADEELLDTVTSDATTGEYRFTTGYYKNLTLVADLPAGTTVTPYNGTGYDNKYKADGLGHGKVWLDIEVTQAQSDLHLGVIAVTPVTIGGAEPSTAIIGKKALEGDRTNTDITAGQFTFSITPDAANPVGGAEDVPATITHGAGAADGAALDFTGADGWTFNKEGIYRYTLAEVAGSAPGFSYDEARYEVEVAVTLDPVTLNLLASVSVLKDGVTYAPGFQAIDFTNTYGKPYTVTYNGNGNTAGAAPIDADSPYDAAASVTVLDKGDLARAGHEFVSWNTVAAGGGTEYLAGETFNIAESTTLYAQWQKKLFEVSWETSEGGTIAPSGATEQVLYGDSALTDVTATPQGDGVSGDQYAFTGWSYRYLPDGVADVPENYEQGTVADYKTVAVKGNVTFTAQFAKQPFVNVNAVDGFVKIADGSTAPSITDPKLTTDKVEYDSMASSGETVSISFEARTHYHLAKVTVSDLYGHTKVVYTDAAGQAPDTDFTMEDSALTISTAIGADPVTAGSITIANVKNSLSVQVTFEEDPKYNVNFYAMAGDPAPYWVNADLYANDKQGAAPATDPARPGWTFVGWSMDGTAAAEKAYDPHELIVDHDVNVYAVWTGNIYYVHYDLAGGLYNDSQTLPAKPVAWSEANLLPANEPDREGYDFTGWTKDGVAVTAAETYESLVADDTVRSITLTANWDPHAFEVAFEKNAPDAEGSMANQAFVYDVEQALTANAFTRSGYDFAGWSLAPAGNVVYADGASVKNLASDHDATVTLYAQWNERGDTPYSVEHYVQKADGTWEVGEIENLTARTNAVVSAVPKDRTASGFENQVHDPDNASAVPSGTVANDGNLVLKLYYRLALQVTFDARGGQPEPADEEVLRGDTIAAPADPMKTGYGFTSWVRETAAGDATWIFDDPVTADLALVARYDANTYTVTYLPGADGVEGAMADQAFVYDVEQPLTTNAFTRDGYTFDHWVVVANPNLRMLAARTIAAEGDTFSDGQFALNLTADADGTVFLQAVWTLDPVVPDPGQDDEPKVLPMGDPVKASPWSIGVRTGDGFMGVIAPIAGFLLLALIALLIAARKLKGSGK